MNCLHCHSEHIVKDGSMRGKEKDLCKDCGRQFTIHPTRPRIPEETWRLVDRLLLEKIPLAGIARVTGISASQLQIYVNQKYQDLPHKVQVIKKKVGKLTIECDEAWSFVSMKQNKIWIWLAEDVETRELVGVYIGQRDRTGAEGLWQSLPSIYRQCATTYTDFWEVYTEIFPSKRHKVVDKASGKTSHIERFNTTLRQRVSRLVRKTLSFSKKFTNHCGAI